ncbi:MAG: AraC family transcriptional regulator, partial [Paracoccus sp. (in: a-proteobacteria)]|nr:AraC family transcriptional regulator [Paracoccus sp. (in: a-proteobacteria)]
DVLIQLTPEFADQLLDSFPEVESCRKLFRMASYGMAFSGQTAESGAQMLHQIGETSGINRLIAFLDLLQVLTKTESEQTILSQIAPALGVHSPHSRRLEGLVAFIDSHFRDNISLGDAARRLNMEDSTFSRFFKKHTGHGFVDYLNHLRVHHACTLLTRTSLPVTAVCFESGFNNTANFNKQFLRICRETPKEYRKRTRSFLQNELQTGIFNAEGQL